MQSPEALHVANSLRLAREIDAIAANAERVLKTAARQAIRKIDTTGGLATRAALEAQLSQIREIFRQAGLDSYDRFVDDLAKYLSRWTVRDQREVTATVQSAIDQGDLAQAAASAGPAAGIGPGVAGQALISEQALRVVSTMPPMELAVVGSAKQPYSLGREFANAFLTPDNKSLQQDFYAKALNLNSVFEAEIRGGVLTGATNADIIRQLKGEGELVGKMNAPISQMKTLAITGAQSTANAVQVDQLQQNTAVEYVRYLATLDQRTSPICRQLDGEIFRKDDAPRPPLHFRCRSTLVGHIPGRESGGRSMTLAVKDGDKVKFVGAYDPKYQNSFTAEQKALIEKNKSGKPPTYADWLKAQPAAAQDAILGAKNGKIYRNTGSLTKAQSKAATQARGTLPTALKPAQIKKKKPAAANAVKPKAKPKVKAPPAKVPAPAGSAGKTLPVPKDPQFELVNKQLGLSQEQWDAKSAKGKELAVKAAEKKAAPKPKAKASPKPAPKPSGPPSAAEIDAANKKIKEASKVLLVGKPTDATFKQALKEVDEAKAVLAKAPKPKAAAAAPSGLSKRPRGPEAGKLKSENKKVIRQGDLTTSDIEYEPTPDDLGWSNDQMVELGKDLEYWSENGYKRMRGAQLVKNKARPKTGTPDWRAMDDYKKGLNAAEQAEALASSDNLEDFVSRAPKYKGQVHRGINLPNEQAYDSFMSDLTKGKKVNTLESWSADEEIATGFANGSNSATIKRGSPGIEVVMHVENKHGSPIAAFSALGSEDEVLMPSKVRYKVLKKTVITEDSDDLLFESFGGKRKRVEVYLEQIED